MCREHLSQLRQHEHQLKQLDIQVLVVSFEVGSITKDYALRTRLKWPILIDTRKTLYTAYGMERGTTWNIFGPAAIWAYAKLLVRGKRLQKPGSDVHQLGGDVLVDREGTVKFHHIGRGPADRPVISTLLEPVVCKD